MIQLGENTIQGQQLPSVVPATIVITILVTLAIVFGCWRYSCYRADNKAFHHEEIFLRNKAIAMAMLTTIDGVTSAYDYNHYDPMCKQIECTLRFGIDREEVRSKFNKFSGELWYRTAGMKFVGNHYHEGLHGDEGISLSGDGLGRGEIELVFKQTTKEEKISELKNNIASLQESIKDPLQEKAVIVQKLDEHVNEIKEQIFKLQEELGKLTI